MSCYLRKLLHWYGCRESLHVYIVLRMKESAAKFYTVRIHTFCEYARDALRRQQNELLLCESIFTLKVKREEEKKSDCVRKVNALNRKYESTKCMRSRKKRRHLSLISLLC